VVPNCRDRICMRRMSSQVMEWRDLLFFFFPCVLVWYRSCALISILLWLCALKLYPWWPLYTNHPHASTYLVATKSVTYLLLLAWSSLHRIT
jgi:hypothetical protein